MLLVVKCLEIPQTKLSLGNCIDMNAVGIAGKARSIHKIAIIVLKGKLFQLLIDERRFSAILSKT